VRNPGHNQGHLSENHIKGATLQKIFSLDFILYKELVEVIKSKLQAKAFGLFEFLYKFGQISFLFFNHRILFQNNNRSISFASFSQPHLQC